MIQLAVNQTSAQVLLEPGYYLWLLGPSCQVTFADGHGGSVTLEFIAPATTSSQWLTRFPVPLNYGFWLTIKNTSLAASAYFLEQRAPLE